MSTIKSSNEHLTFNADGSAKEIRFQANGTQKASISSAGAFTSTTIDATVLTGNLPAISGASLTGVTDSAALPKAGGTMTGALIVVGPTTINPDTAGKNTIRLTSNAANDGRILINSDTTLKVDIQANGSTFFNGGNVGIGTASPAELLTLKAGSTEETMLLFEDNSATDIGSIGIHPSNGFVIQQKVAGGSVHLMTHDGNEDINLDSDGFIQFEAAGSERMRIDSSGKVSIGIANAAGLNSSGLALTNEFRIHGGTDGGVMSLATSYKAYQLGGGDAIGALYFTDATSGVWAGIKASADAQGGGSLSSPLNANDYPGRLEFYTTPDGSGTPTERMRINKSGNVGIGTTTPDSVGSASSLSGNNFKIGSTSAASRMIIEGASSADIHLADLGGSSGARQFRIRANADKLTFASATEDFGTITDTLTIDHAGNVGIGTASPLRYLHVYGDTWADATSNQEGICMYAGSGSTSAPIYFNNEFNANAKAIYQESYYLVIRGHDNEGIKFKGNGNSPTTRYQFNMGNNSNTCFNASNSSSWNTTSDSRIKENVVTLPSGSLAKINALRPVTFDYTDDWATKMGWYEFSKNNSDDPNDLTNDGFDLTQKNNDIGWIAQEYKTIFPQDIKTSESTVGENTYADFHTMKPDSLLPHLVKAVQELSAENEALKARITTLENA